MKIQQLNTDALSQWDFEALYEPGVKDIDGELLRVESFFRHVWFPIETLTLTVALPDANRDIGWRAFAFPDRGRFEAPAEGTRTRLDASLAPVQEGILQWRPPEVFDDVPWPAIDTSTATNVTWTSDGRTSTLVVSRPQVGTCYAIEWKPVDATPSARAQDIEQGAQRFRQALLRYKREQRRTPDGVRIHDRFARFANTLWEQYGDKRPDERFEVTLLTYDNDERRLKVVDGWSNSREATHEQLDFTLPFGLGLAGACFKRGDRVFLHVRDTDAPSVTDRPRTMGSAGPPDYFIEIPGHPPPGVILAVPGSSHDRANTIRVSLEGRRCPYRRQAWSGTDIECPRVRHHSLRRHLRVL